MPLFDQVAGRQLRALPILDADGVEVVVLHIAVHQHDGHADLLELVQVPARIGADEYDAVQPAIPRDAQIALVLLGAGQQQVIAVLSRHVFDGGQQIAVKGVGEHELLARFGLGNQHADEVAPPAGQAAGIQVRHVIQPLDRIQNALGRLRADGLRGRAVQHIADRADRNPGFLGHILDANALHGRPLLCCYLNVSVIFYCIPSCLSRG